MPQPIRIPERQWQELDGVQEPFSIRRFQGVSKITPTALEPGYASNLYNVSSSSYPALAVRGGMVKVAQVNPSVRFEDVEGRKGIRIESGTTNLFPAFLADSFAFAWTSDVLNGTYTVSIRGGTGSLVLSGGAKGEVRVGESLTFTVSNATVTFTPSGGEPQKCQLEPLPYATSWQTGKETKTTPLDTDAGGGLAPSAESYTTGTASGSFSIDSTIKYAGYAASQKINRTGGGESDRFGVEITPNNVNEAPVCSVLIRTKDLASPAYAVITVQYGTYWESGVFIALEEYTQNISNGLDWTWINLPQSTNPSSNVVKLYVYIVNGNGYIHVQDVKVESYANTRESEIVTIPVSELLSPSSGQLEVGLRLTRTPGSVPQYIFDCGGPVNKNLALYVGTDGRVRCEYGTGSSTVTLTGTTALLKDMDYRVGVRWTQFGVHLMVNNAVEASSSVPPTLEFSSILHLGSKADGTCQLDGIVKKLGPVPVWQADFTQGARQDVNPYTAPGFLTLVYTAAVEVSRTSQTDFNLGTTSNTDSTTKPGSVLLSRQP